MASDPPHPSVSAPLAQSYRQARYVVLTSRPLAFRIDQQNPLLARCLSDNGVSTAGFVTAANPGSILRSREWNDAAMDTLRGRVERMGYPWLPGVAEDPAQAWPDEPSLLIPGIGRQQTLALGAAFGQNAVVWIDPTGLPTLVWTRAGSGLPPGEAG